MKSRLSTRRGCFTGSWDDRLRRSIGLELPITNHKLQPMSETKSFHMSPEEFRRQGYAVVDWIADYHSRIESFPVLSQVQPGETRSKLPPNAPEQGESFDQILSDIERVILP